MNIVNILIVVDTLSAASTGNLKDNVYLIDTEKYLGSWNEGLCDLHTLTEDGQLIKWSVTSITPENSVEIAEFSGPMINLKTCIPKKQGIEGDIFWEGRVEASPGRYSYTLALNIQGEIMTFSPYIEVQ